MKVQSYIGHMNSSSISSINVDPTWLQAVLLLLLGAGKIGEEGRFLCRVPACSSGNEVRSRSSIRKYKGLDNSIIVD